MTPGVFGDILFTVVAFAVSFRMHLHSLLIVILPLYFPFTVYFGNSWQQPQHAWHYLSVALLQRNKQYTSQTKLAVYNARWN